MADGIRYVAISCNMIAGDEEFRSLPIMQRYLWYSLLNCPLPQRSGLFKGGLHLLAGYSDLPLDEVKQGLAKFEELGWIVRDGDYRWIRNRIKYSNQSPQWLYPAYGEAYALLKKTPLARQLLDYYNQPEIQPPPPNTAKGRMPQFDGNGALR